MLRTRFAPAAGALLIATIFVAGCTSPDDDAETSPAPTPSPSYSMSVTKVTPTPSASPVEPAPMEFAPAMKLVEYFQSTGLVVQDPRDNTDKGWCEPDMWECVEFLTSEQVSIIIQPSAEGAERMSAGGNVYVSSDGNVALSFAAQRTPVEQQQQYTRALEDYLLTLAAQG